MGKKMIQSWIFKMFEPLIDKKNTLKRRKVKNLAYNSLKLFPKLAFILVRLFARNEFEKKNFLTG